MKKWFKTGFVLVLLLQLFKVAQAYDVIDDRGVKVSFNQAPQRVVTLLPSLTETVCELGACSRLVGTDRYSNWPAQIKNVQKVGGLDDTNIEMVVALKPDVVLLATSSRVSDRLQQLGLKVVALEPKTHADVQRVMQKVSLVLQAGDSAKVWRHIDAAVSAAAQSIKPHARGQRVYFEVNNGPYAAGASSFIGETLTRLGAKNIVSPELGPFPKLNPEFIVRADPDLILVSERNFPGLRERPGWNRLRAIRENHLCVFKIEESDHIIRPGPRMAEGARLLAQCLNEKGMNGGRR
jgi:iron complex transport system substrate-binding protein